MARRAKGAGAATPAITSLQRATIVHKIHSYDAIDEAPSYGEAVAAALGVDARRLFKTLVTTVDGSLTVAVVPVAGSLDLKALAAAAGGKKAAMAEPAAAERSSGYVTGGISPIGQRTALPTVVDASALEWLTIFVSAGRRGLQVELAPHDLVRITSGATAAIGAP